MIVAAAVLDLRATLSHGSQKKRVYRSLGRARKFLPEGYPCKDLLVSTESEVQCNRLHVAYSIAVIPVLLDSRTLILFKYGAAVGSGKWATPSS